MTTRGEVEGLCLVIFMASFLSEDMGSQTPVGSRASASEHEGGFESVAAAVATELRASLGKVLDCIPGNLSRPLDIAAALSIDMNLAWKICNLVGAADPFAGLQMLPGDSAMKTFLKAAAAAGVERGALAGLESALSRYRRLTADHAGSRLVLDSLLGHIATSGATRAELTARRNAFRAVSSLVGVQAEVQVVTYLFSPLADACPLPDPLSTQASIIRGFIGLCRLRPDLSWIIGTGRRVNNTTAESSASTSRPIDPVAAARYGGVPILPGRRTPRGCNEQLILRRVLSDGSVVDRVEPGPVGRQGEMTFFTGETLSPALLPVVDLHHSHLQLLASPHTPSESLVFDLLFHKHLPPLGPPELSLFSSLGGVNAGNADPRDCISLALCESLEPRGIGLSGLRLEESSDYLETLEDVCTRLRIDPAKLETWRVRIKFPPVPCAVMVQRRMLW